jgi:hypothetical protein
MDKSTWSIVYEEEWYRVYTSSTHPRIYESKFATGEASITLAELQSRWQGWNEGEQVQFAQAFKWKPVLDSEDELILDFLIRQDGEMLSASIANMVAKLPNKREAARFLVDCLKAYPQNRGNFLTALADLAAPETVSDLSSVFHECSQKIIENPEDHSSLIDLLYCSAALFRTTAEIRYRDLINYYLQHTNDKVRYQAENAMRWAGITSR